MDNTKTPALDPKLKEAYDRVMGISTTPVTQSTPLPSNDVSTTLSEDQPAIPAFPPEIPIANPSTMSATPMQPISDIPESKPDAADMTSPSSLPTMPSLDEAIAQTPQVEEHLESAVTSPEPVVPSEITETNSIPESMTLPTSEPLTDQATETPPSIMSTAPELSSDALPTQELSQTITEPTAMPTEGGSFTAPIVPPVAQSDAVVSSSYLPNVSSEPSMPEIPQAQVVAPLPSASLADPLDPMSSYSTPYVSPQVNPISSVSPISPISPSFPSTAPMETVAPSYEAPLSSAPQTAAPVIPMQPIGHLPGPKSSSMQKKILIIAVTIIFMIAYALIWIKVLGFPLPFLSQ